MSNLGTPNQSSFRKQDDLDSKINQAQQTIQKKVENIQQQMPSAKQVKDKVNEVKDKVSDAIDKNVSDDMKQTASQIKEDVQQSLNQTQQQLQKAAKNMSKQMDRGFGPWLREQQATSRQYWNDIMKQPTSSKALLGCLLFTNLVMPLFFMNRIEGFMVFFTYCCVSVLSHFLYGMAPQNSPNRLFTSTFSHLLWVPLLFWLSTRSSKFDVVSSKAEMEHVDVAVSILLRKGFFVTNWIRAVLTINAIALTLDAIKLGSILQQRAGSANKINRQQQLPKSSVGGDRHQLIGENEGSNEDRQRAFEREQEGIKQRLRSNVTAPTA